MKSRKSYCTTPGVGVSKKFNVKVFYVMGKALSGKLSCPCDRSCCLVLYGLKCENGPPDKSVAGLQIRRSNRDNLGIILNISLVKHIL